MVANRCSPIKYQESNQSKPAFERLLEYAHSGDTIFAWKLDRLVGNTVKLIELVEELAKRKRTRLLRPYPNPANF